jgi:hypothetical protein
MWAISLAGMGLSAYSTIKEGKAAEELGEAQQAAFEGEAQAAVLAGAEESRLKRKEGRELLASQIATISASGGGFAGSNLAVMAESAKNVEMDALTIERNTQTRAKSLRTRGAFARYEGDVARRRSQFRALSGGLKGIGSMYSQYKTDKYRKDRLKYLKYL